MKSNFYHNQIIFQRSETFIQIQFRKVVFNRILAKKVQEKVKKRISNNMKIKMKKKMKLKMKKRMKIKMK